MYFGFIIRLRNRVVHFGSVNIRSYIKQPWWPNGAIVTYWFDVYYLKQRIVGSSLLKSL